MRSFDRGIYTRFSRVSVRFKRRIHWENASRRRSVPECILPLNTVKHECFVELSSSLELTYSNILGQVRAKMCESDSCPNIYTFKAPSLDRILHLAWLAAYSPEPSAILLATRDELLPSKVGQSRPFSRWRMRFSCR